MVTEEKQVDAKALVVGKAGRATLPESLLHRMGAQPGDLLLALPQPDGAILLRRIDGRGLVEWLKDCDPKFSIPPEEMLENLRRVGFDATLKDGRVSYEGGELDVWTNWVPVVRDEKVVIEETSGLHNGADVLDFILTILFGRIPSSPYAGRGFQHNGWVSDLAKRLGVPD